MITEVVWVSIITSVTAIINTLINSRVTKKNIEKSEERIIDKAASKSEMQQLRDSMLASGMVLPPTDASPSIPDRRITSSGPTTGPMRRRRADDLPEPKPEEENR